MKYKEIALDHTTPLGFLFAIALHPRQYIEWTQCIRVLHHLLSHHTELNNGKEPKTSSGFASRESVYPMETNWQYDLRKVNGMYTASE